MLLINTMIVIKLSGGMGNQMFQYAFGLKWAEYHSTSLFVDLSWFESNRASSPSRPFVLDFFHTDISSISQSSLYKIKIPILLNNTFLAKAWNRFIFKTNKNYIKQKNIIDLYENDQIPNNSYLEGTWISKKHCGDISATLKNHFQIKSECILQHPIQNEILGSNSVALHVRRGDYLTTGNFLLKIDYFFKGIKQIKKSLPTKVHFFVFSDDIEWCKIQFNEYMKEEQLQLSYIDKSVPSGKDDIYHFYLMRSCKHFIISNSTFSWWAAWLGDYKNKFVVCPSQFEHQNIQHKHLILPDWQSVTNTI